MDIEKTLGSVEQELRRLTSQHEQEVAMHAVLPQRFAMNMATFERLMPDIHDYFKDYQPSRPFRFFCNENGEPNLLWLDEQVALYGQNPYGDARDQVRDVIDNAELNCIDFIAQWFIDGQIHIKYNNDISNLKNKSDLEGLRLSDALDCEIPLALMYGVGLGYQLGYLYEQCRVKHLFAFEPDVDMFYASLFCFDWHALLTYMEQESLSLHLFIGVDEQTLVSDMMEALHRKGAFWSASYFSFFHYHSEKIHRLIEKVEHEFYLLKTGWGFFDDNIYALAHSHHNLTSGTPFLLKKRANHYSDTPVFVVGNGPSLDGTIEFIRQHQHQAVIIACGTAVSALYKADIKPDIYVAVERTKSSADFLEILNAHDFLKDVTFLSVDVIHPECQRFFRQTGLALKPNEPMYSMLFDACHGELVHDLIEYPNPFVGNTGLNYAALLGFKRAYLFGIDNGFRDAHKHHSSLSLYYNDKKETKMVNETHDTFPARANFGGEVRINHLFGLSIHNMECVLRKSEMVCFNCSDGAYIDGARPTPVDTITLTGPAIDKSQLMQNLMKDNFAPFDLSRIDFDAALDSRFFSEMIEKCRADWRDVEPEYNAVLTVMQRHHDYLLYLLMSTNKRHFYRVLIGSINYFYANIISVMMAHLKAPADVLADKIKAALNILDAFFEDAQVIYADAFERHDATYFSGLDVFKHA
jgi:hypothetical protein